MPFTSLPLTVYTSTLFWVLGKCYTWRYWCGMWRRRDSQPYKWKDSNIQKNQCSHVCARGWQDAVVQAKFKDVSRRLCVFLSIFSAFLFPHLTFNQRGCAVMRFSLRFEVLQVPHQSSTTIYMSILWMLLCSTLYSGQCKRQGHSNYLKYVSPFVAVHLAFFGTCSKLQKRFSFFSPNPNSVRLNRYFCAAQSTCVAR